MDVSIEPPVESEERLRDMVAALRQDACASSPPGREIALFMLQYYEQEEHVPAARIIARATRTSRCTAYRHRAAILIHWRHALDLHPWTLNRRHNLSIV